MGLLEHRLDVVELHARVAATATATVADCRGRNAVEAAGACQAAQHVVAGLGEGGHLGGALCDDTVGCDRLD